MSKLTIKELCSILNGENILHEVCKGNLDARLVPNFSQENHEYIIELCKRHNIYYEYYDEMHLLLDVKTEVGKQPCYHVFDHDVNDHYTFDTKEECEAGVHGMNREDFDIVYGVEVELQHIPERWKIKA